jgi:hypothetical protein
MRAQIVCCSRLFIFIFLFLFLIFHLNNYIILLSYLTTLHPRNTDLFPRGICMAGPDNGNGQIGEMRAIVSTLSFDHALATNTPTSSNTGLTCNFKWNV